MNMLISGKSVPSSDGKTIDVINPATGELIDTVPDATKEDVDLAVACSKKGQLEWAEKPLFERSMILTKYVSLVEENREEIANLLTREMGKPYKQSFGELGIVGAMVRGFLEVAKHKYDVLNPRGGMPGRGGDIQMVVREPLGTIAGILPFNAPTGSMIQKSAPALIMGNASITKPASDNPLAVIRLVELLVEAGVPVDAAQVVTGRGGTCGAYLASAPGVNGITFTGSTAVGLEIARMGDLHLAYSSLELGGNDPCIVLEDADLDIAVPDIVQGRLANSGQICVSPKRLLVHESLVDEFTKRLLAEIPKVKMGDPFDPDTAIGPLISEKAAIEVERQVNLTVSQGASLIYGGERKGAFYTPAVLTGVTRDMDIANDMEVFGPVFAIISVKDEAEALSIANQTAYGLSGGVFTKDISRGAKLAAKVVAGGCVVNGTGFYISPYQPFGGAKMSGKGRAGWSTSLDEVTYLKTITIKNLY